MSTPTTPPAPATAEQLSAARQARDAADQAAEAAKAAHSRAQRTRGADTTATQATLNQATAAKKAAEDAYAQLRNRNLQGMLHPEDWELVVDQIERSCRGGKPSAFVDDVVQPCERVGNNNCAGVKPPPNQQLPPELFDDARAAMGKSKIDLEALTRWEGGLATTGYVPWWPQSKSIGIDRGAIVLDTSRDSSGRLLGAVGQSSGVTIGLAVDLGGQRPAEFRKRLEAAGASKELIDKLMPYVGLKEAAACTYLRDNPLTITNEEAVLISTEMLKEKHTTTADHYNKITQKEFSDLSPVEQTILYSRTYQDGNLTRRHTGNRDLAEAASAGDRPRFLQLLQDRAVNKPLQCMSPDYAPTTNDLRRNGGRIWKEFQYASRQPWPAPAPPPGP